MNYKSIYRAIGAFILLILGGIIGWIIGANIGGNYFTGLLNGSNNKDENLASEGLEHTKMRSNWQDDSDNIRRRHMLRQ